VAESTDARTEDLLTLYMRDVRKFGILDRATEADLVKRWQQSSDPAAAEQLVGSHQRLVVKMAVDYRGYGCPLTDLIAEGNVGLMHAIDKFDLDRGYRLSTYAMWWIRASITEYVMRSASLVRMVNNENQKKLFFNLRRLKRTVETNGEATLSPQAVTAIAEKLDVPEAEVILMDRRLSTPEVSVNSPVTGESDIEFQDLLTDDAIDQETRVIDADEIAWRRELLADALDRLDDRERRILVERKLKDNPPKLADLSKEFGVSRERVRQIEARAFEKLKRLMREAAAPAQRRKRAA
jgi:RNA polymerase sigma-32 factor